MIYKIHTRDDEKLCFAEKTKSIILQKSGGAMAPLAPPVSTALDEKIFRILFKGKYISGNRSFQKIIYNLINRTKIRYTYRHTTITFIT